MKIAVLGTGLMGRTLSMRLYQDGYTNLTLIDQDNHEGKNSPAYIAAGIISPYFESVMGGISIYKLGQSSLSLWHKYLSLLDSKHLCNNNGTLLLATDGFITDLDHYINKISFNTKAQNYYNFLDRTAILALEPQLNFNHAYHLPHEGSLNAREIFKTLGNYLFSKVNWYSETKINYPKPSQTVSINGINHHFDLVIDCRGLGGGDIQPNLRGVRGEIIRVFAPDVKISHPIRLFHPRQNIYINPYNKDHYVIGATEIEAEDFSPISMKSALELLSFAYNLHKGFAESRILEMNTNCRPTLTNNLPRIMAQNNFISINGLYRHGFLLAPTLAETIINYITNGIKQYPEIWS